MCVFVHAWVNLFVVFCSFQYRIFLNSFFYWMGLCTPGRQHIEDDISGKESEEVLLQRVVDEELKAVVS